MTLYRLFIAFIVDCDGAVCDFDDLDIGIHLEYHGRTFIQTSRGGSEENAA